MKWGAPYELLHHREHTDAPPAKVLLGSPSLTGGKLRSISLLTRIFEATIAAFFHGVRKLKSKITKQFHWMNKKQAVAGLGVSSSTFNAWGIEPVARIGRETFFGIEALVENRAAAKAKEYRKTIAKLESRIAELESGELEDRRTIAQVKYDQEVARTRVLEEQADALAMKNEVARHETAPFYFITYVLAKTANEIAGVMDAMPVELLRKLSLQPKDVEKIKGVTAVAAGSIANLGDETWLEEALDEFIAQTD